MRLAPGEQRLLRRWFRRGQHPVALTLYRDRGAIDHEAMATARLLEKLAEGRIRVEARDWPPRETLPAGVYRPPTWTWRDAGGRDPGWRFEGAPTGYVFSAVVQVTLDLMATPPIRGEEDGGPAPARLLVLVAPTSPYCPHVIRVGYLWARRRKNLVTRVVDVASFPAWATASGVTQVPQVVVADNHGAVRSAGVGVPDFRALWAAIGGRGMPPFPEP